MTTISIAGVDVDTRHWIVGQRMASPETFDDVSPVDGRVLGQVARGGRAEAGPMSRQGQARRTAGSRIERSFHYSPRIAMSA